MLKRQQAADAPAWFQQKHSQAALSCVAYFSMEFMLSESLSIYSGDFGNMTGAYTYTATLSAMRDANYAARLIPYCGVAIPMEALKSCGSADLILLDALR